MRAITSRAVSCLPCACAPQTSKAALSVATTMDLIPFFRANMCHSQRDCVIVRIRPQGHESRHSAWKQCGAPRCSEQVYPAPQPRALRRLVGIHFDDRVGKLRARFDFQLVRYVGWNMDDIARAKLLRLPALNRRTSHFMRLDRFRSNHGSAHNKSGFAGVDDHNIGLDFVKFGAAVAFTMGNSDEVVSIGAQRLPGKFLIVNLAGEFAAGIFDRSTLPKTEALRIGGAEPGRRSEKHDQQTRYLHSISSKNKG